ncbi:hypothetical protein GCM10025789_09960 [Tessaracoccus lubricantis]|uniref:Copper oxidase n=1 Tax=Tessaracoccus lubricantis TaxID=545543 RepID=A0ABP9FEZ2_9ACTN
MSLRDGRRLARLTGLVALVVLLVATGWLWGASRLPSSYSAADMGVADWGGGPQPDAHGQASGVAVASLDGGLTAEPDVRVTLTARAERVTLPDGKAFDGFTLNGSTPGPEIRAVAGQVVEVVLHNEDVDGGTTLHWHGLDVPNAMDGVAGVTQDAVHPGESFTYRFRAEQVGTFWYHAHQLSHRQVLGGLLGALVIEPEEAPADAVMLLHTYPGTSRTVNGTREEVRVAAPDGATVRVRVVNTDNAPTVVWASGSFTLAAIDGVDVVAPTPVEHRKVTVTGGGRADLEVTAPARVQAPGVTLVVGDGAPGETPAPDEELDPLGYGSPAPLGFDPDGADRNFTYDIGRLPGFLDGAPGYWWTINGRMGRNVPMYMVREGDIVRMRISNGSGEVHPMHLHGHHMVVLARNGVPASGSPWWVDSLNVEHGDTFDVAFVADNPGIWMDHCHNLPHAREGLMTHLMYDGVAPSYLLGAPSGNEPE